MHQTTLYNAQQAHETLRSLWAWAKPRLMAGHRLTLSVAEERRNLEQNARMWAMLTEVSQQVVWHGQKLSKEEWKDVFTASLKRQKVVPGLDGGFVVLGSSTSKMTKAEMSELIDLICAFGAQNSVVFSDAEQEQA